MARQFNGTTDWAQSTNNVDLSGTNQLSVAFWLYWNAFANDDKTALELGASGALTVGGFSVNPNDSTNNGGGQFSFGSQVGAYQYCTFTRPSAATYHHYLFTFDESLASSTLKGYVDGTSQTLSYTLNNAPSGNFGNLKLNFMARNGGASLWAAGRLAEVGLWPGLILGQNDATALAAGYRPIHVRPDKLGWHWPCRFPGAASEPELIKANAMTLSGTSSADHPRIIY